MTAWLTESYWTAPVKPCLQAAWGTASANELHSAVKLAPVPTVEPPEFGA